MGNARNLGNLLNTNTKIAADDLNVGQLGNRNLIINGDMRVNQRGIIHTVTSNRYTLDRWKVYQGASPAVVVASQSTLNQTDPLVGQGFRNYMYIGIDIGTGTSGTTARMVRQKVEDVYRVVDKTLTYSFWIKGNAAAAAAGSYFIDMFVNYGESQDTLFSDQSINGTISTEWVRKTHTFTIPAATDFILDGSFLEIMINLINDTAGIEYNITGVQLEVGDKATPFEHRSYDQELALCQRYYQSISYPRWSYLGTGFKQVNYVFGPLAGFNPQNMRTTPTASKFTSTGAAFIGSKVNIGGSHDFSGIGVLGKGVYLTGGTTFTDTTPQYLEFNSGSGVVGYITLDAEL